MKDFYNLLPGRNATQDSFSDCFVPDSRDELLRDLKIDICFKQSQAHLSQCAVHIGLADRAVPAEIFEDLLQFVA